MREWRFGNAMVGHDCESMLLATHAKGDFFNATLFWSNLAIYSMLGVRRLLAVRVGDDVWEGRVQPRWLMPIHIPHRRFFLSTHTF